MGRLLRETAAARLRRRLSELHRTDLVTRVHSSEDGTAHLDAHVVHDWGSEVRGRARTPAEVDELVEQVAELPTRTPRTR